MKSFWRVFIIGLVIFAALMYVTMQASAAAVKTLLGSVVECGYFFGNGIPHVFFGEFLLAFLMFSLFVGRIWFMLMKTHKWISGMLTHAVPNTNDIIVQFEHENQVQVTIVQDERPMAFSYGLFQSRIVITTGQVSLVDSDELRAILEHERYHCLRKDPLKVLIVKSQTFALFFLPILRPLQDRFLLDKELEADRAAVSKVGLKPVASGLYKVLQLASFQTPDSFAIGPNHVSDARIDSLLSSAVKIDDIPWRCVVISTASLIAIGTLVITLYSSMTMIPMHTMMSHM